MHASRKSKEKGEKEEIKKVKNKGKKKVESNKEIRDFPSSFHSISGLTFDKSTDRVHLEIAK